MSLDVLVKYVLIKRMRVYGVMCMLKSSSRVWSVIWVSFGMSDKIISNLTIVPDI